MKDNTLEAQSHVGKRVMWNTGSYPNLRSHVGQIVADAENIQGFATPMVVVAEDLSEQAFPLSLIPSNYLVIVKG